MSNFTDIMSNKEGGFGYLENSNVFIMTNDVIK